ncbi:hypothetical protein TWF481_007784 [Arthrobotrys musiformis]|uniref:Uncharacterized protein n=1 Tax=Arthrobotrys musiformis TaxID=47236 RepID=A0AAV9W578_9PEZI
MSMMDLVTPSREIEEGTEKNTENEIPEDRQPTFPHPLDASNTAEPDPLTWREKYLRNFSRTIRSKPNWTEKILDRDLFVKWVRETLEKTLDSDDDKLLSWDHDDIEFSYKELTEAYKKFVDEAKTKPQLYGLEPDIDCVWRSDSLIDEELRKELIDAVATLEDVPENEKDWHPGSNGQVLDLVHPSLWPIIYGRSISLIDGKPIKLPENAIDDDGDSDDSYSKKFCWLPSEFEVGADGTVKIASYINNLSSPEQQKLFYPILERIFQRFVPLFNHVLADLKRGMQDFKRVSSPAGYPSYGDEEIQWLFSSVHKEKFGELLAQFKRGEELTIRLSEFIHVFRDTDEWETDDSDSDDSLENDDSSETSKGVVSREDLEYNHWIEVEGDDTTAPFQVRDMGTLQMNNLWSPPEISGDVMLEGRTAKVIVKLANIILTPENPVYKGGSWHVEAMKNERIISTGIYYYDQENITDSALNFRRTIPGMESFQYQLSQNSNWATVHDMAYKGSAVQKVGSINTQNNRAIAFPNIYQHRLKPFKLINKKKPGYRKILAFFLCDPTDDSIPTSRIVAPQQPEAREHLVDALRMGPLGMLPEEVFRLIVDGLPRAVTRKEAETYRQQLMKERSSFNGTNEAVRGETYHLCEH